MRTLLLFLLVYNFTFSQTKKQETVEKKYEPIEVKTINEIKVGDADYYEETLPFAVVEQIPLFENCKNVEKKDQMNCFYEEMKKHVKKHLKYPKEAKDNKVDSRVVAIFDIDKNGKVINIRVRSNQKDNYKILFEEETKRIISLLPDFIPGTQRKKTVVVTYSIPVIFKL
jgi:outer membrane biosynthesis protein TonB